MKTIAFLTTILFSASLMAKDFVPLNVKAGLWEYKNDINMEDFLPPHIKNLPKEQKEMMMKMMEKSMKSMNKSMKQCMTEEQIKNPRAQFDKATKGNKNMKDCEMVVIESSKSSFTGKLKCKDGKGNLEVKVLVKNPKSIETEANIIMPGGKNTKVASKGTWISANCP